MQGKQGHLGPLGAGLRWGARQTDVGLGMRVEGTDPPSRDCFGQG